VQQPLITAIVPTYGRQEQLIKALHSIAMQDTHLRLDVIVVDDNPPTSWLQASNKELIATAFPGFKYIINKRRKGGSGARNTGILSAESEWIAFLDDDDEWLENKLSAQFKLLQDTDIDVAGIASGYWINDISKECNKRIIPPINGWEFKDLLVKRMSRAPKLSTFLCRKDILLKAGLFDEDLPARQDLDLYLRLSRLGRIISVQQELAIKTVHSGERISTNSFKKLKAYQIFYKKYKQDLSKNILAHFIFLRQLLKWWIRCECKKIIDRFRQYTT
jgi:glycosyltransferase involved in cell wall biosynthesis